MAPRRPSVPYVGVRAYGFDEHAIFTGRDADVEQVGHLVANRTHIRIVLLHGQTGCGKSSFLKAGLIPELMSPEAFDTTVYTRPDARAASQFIMSSEDPMLRLAEVAAALVREHVRLDKQVPWLSDLDLSVGLEAAVPRLAKERGLMERWFAALAPHLKRPLLLVVDQAEEVFTLRVGRQAEEARELYFDFLAAFCRRSSWIQLMISMRTEFYGRFDHELRRRVGVTMPVASYYLEPFPVSMLEAAITQPLTQCYWAGVDEYRFEFEAGLPARIAAEVADAFPGPGALTCLQIVCMRLSQQALSGLAPPRPSNGVVFVLPKKYALKVTFEMYNGIGPISNVIEDVVDQAIGDFCEQRGLRLLDSVRLWRVAKNALGTLVTQQPGAAPTTKFIEHDKFLSDLSRRAVKTLPRWLRWMLLPLLPVSSTAEDRLLVADLVDHLLRPNVRVLREVEIVDAGAKEPTRSVALGHDVLSVGLVEAMARVTLLDEQQAAENQRLIVSMFFWPLALAFAGVVLSWLAERAGLAWWTEIDLTNVALTTFILGLYGILGVEAFRSTRTGGGGNTSFLQLVEKHQQAYPELPNSRPQVGSLWHTLRGRFALMRHVSARLRSTGLLFREMTNDARRVAAAAGAAAFPGGPRH